MENVKLLIGANTSQPISFVSLQESQEIAKLDNIIYLGKYRFNLLYVRTHGGPENLIKSGPIKHVKSNKSISRKIFLAKFHFL